MRFSLFSRLRDVRYSSFSSIFLSFFFYIYMIATRKFQIDRKGEAGREGERQRTVFIVCVYQALLSGIVTDCNVSTDWSGINRFCDRLETRTTWRGGDARELHSALIWFFKRIEKVRIDDKRASNQLENY